MADFITAENVDQFLDLLESDLVPAWEIEATPGRLPPEKWNIIRRFVLKRDGYKCGNCNDVDKPLDVHHIVPIQSCGTNHASNLRTLCFDCHALIHPWLNGVRHAR